MKPWLDFPIEKQSETTDRFPAIQRQKIVETTDGFATIQGQKIVETMARFSN